MIVAVVHQKGGVGKSTTAAALAQAAAYAGRRVLAVDVNPQPTMTMILPPPPAPPRSTIYDVLPQTEKGTAVPITRATVTLPDAVELVTGDRRLQLIRSWPGSARRLKQALSPVAGDYDIIVIDCPPQGGEMQTAGIYAADKIIVPTTAEPAAVAELAPTMNAIRTANPAADVAIVATMVDARATITKIMLARISEAAAGYGAAFLGNVRRAAAVQEAQALRRSLYEYAPHSKPAADYLRILEAITEEKKVG